MSATAAPQTNEVDDRSILFPETRIVPVRFETGDGEEYEEAEIHVREMSFEATWAAAGAIGDKGKEFAANFVLFGKRYPDRINGFMSAALRLPADRVARLLPNSFLRVARAIFEANPDFFPLLHLQDPGDSAPPATAPTKSESGDGAKSSITSGDAGTPDPNSTRTGK